MPRLIHPLLLLVAQATEKELVLYIEYLKAENRILWSKLPKRISVTPAERAKLVKLGVRLSHLSARPRVASSAPALWCKP